MVNDQPGWKDEIINLLMSVFFEFKEGSDDADGSDGDGK